METRVCNLDSVSAQVVVLIKSIVRKMTHERSKTSYQLSRASTRKTMEQGENMTPVQVMNKSKVNFPLEGGSVNGCKSCTKVLIDV